ncbi:MAG: DUF6644 family protein [Myxococcaceae bacterium]
MRATVAAFCAWLELTPFSLKLQTLEWAIPTVQTVHLLAIAAVMGSMLLFNLRLLGKSGRDVSLGRVSSRFVPVIFGAVVVLLLSGALMICAEPARSLLNPAFQLKMALLLAALAVTAVTAGPLRKNADYWSSSRWRGRLARLLATTSIGLWVGILFAGRWIAYMGVQR